MMNRLFTSTMIAVVVMLYSCKPKDENLNPTPTNLLSGYLLATRSLDADSPATKYSEQVQALFFKHPGDSNLRTAVDSVKMNGTKLALDNATLVYKAASGISLQNATTWQVYSTVTIASFSYDHNMAFPTHNAKLPDTIDHADYTTVILPNGMDSAVVSIRANQLVQGVYKGATASINPTQLFNLNPGAALLEVAGYKATTVAFGGKNFRFIKQTIKSQPIWIK